jgi:hypothetical protein
MVVRNFNVVRPGFPSETNPPLIIHANAVLSGSTTLQPLQAVAWRHAQVRQLDGGIQLQQLPPGGSLDVRRQPAGHLSAEYLFRLRTREVFDHSPTTLTRSGINVKRYYTPDLMNEGVGTLQRIKANLRRRPAKA